MVWLLLLLSVKSLAQFPSSNDANWQLNSSRSDEFSFLDLSKWDIPLEYYHDYNGCDETQVYHRYSGVYIQNNDRLVLQVSTLPQPYYHWNTNANPNRLCYYKYQSGWIYSWSLYSYGYFEVVAKMPMGNHVWPAFWLNDSNWDYPNCFYNEIDIQEICPQFGSQANVIGTFLHVQNNPTGSIDCNNLNNFINHYGITNTGFPDLSTGYHTFACEWLPDRVVWYYDDQPIREIFNNYEVIPNHPMHVILNVAVGATDFVPISGKDAMIVDRFRYYQLKTNNCNQTVVSQSNFNFNTFQYSVTKSFELSNSSIPGGSHVTLRFTDYATFYPDFTVPLGCEFAAIQTPCIQN